VPRLDARVARRAALEAMIVRVTILGRDVKVELQMRRAP